MTYPAGLSDRHVEVLELVAEGLSNAEIGKKLLITENTVKSHFATMAQKTGIRDRAGLVSWGYRVGLLKVPAVRVLPPEAAEMVALARRIVTWADSPAQPWAGHVVPRSERAA